MPLEAYWDLWSIVHIAKHGVTPAEVDYILAHVQPPFPETIGDGKHLVHGQTEAGRWLQVIYVYRAIDTLDWSSVDWEDRVAQLDQVDDEVVYVIHARDLNEQEKRAARRRLR
jgi:hypothetical protein